MTVVLLVIYVVLNVFVFVMWARFVLDFVLTVSRRWRPRGFGLILSEITFTITDPPIKLVRRIVPPIRVGRLAFDLSWGIVLIVAILLIFVISLSAGFLI